jgi:hypothetical protein
MSAPLLACSVLPVALRRWFLFLLSGACKPGLCGASSSELPSRMLNRCNSRASQHPCPRSETNVCGSCLVVLLSLADQPPPTQVFTMLAACGLHCCTGHACRNIVTQAHGAAEALARKIETRGPARAYVDECRTSLLRSLKLCAVAAVFVLTSVYFWPEVPCHARVVLVRSCGDDTQTEYNANAFANRVCPSCHLTAPQAARLA